MKYDNVDVLMVIKRASFLLESSDLSFLNSFSYDNATVGVLGVTCVKKPVFEVCFGEK